MRTRQLHRLIGRLTLGSLSIVEAADVLALSISGTRKYMRELQAAGVIHQQTGMGGDGAANRVTSRLTSDRELIQAFLHKLGPVPDYKGTPRHGWSSDQPAHAHDPLIAALFGAGGE